jgi:integrase
MSTGAAGHAAARPATPAASILKGGKTPKGEIFITTEYLLNREVEHVLAALTPSNRLIMRVCLHTGLRVGDVLKLKTEQIKPRFWITESKTGKRRLVGLPGPLLAELRRQAGPEYVFTGRGGRGRRTRQAVWKDVKRAAKAFRLPQNVAPHSFRKVYAVRLMEDCRNIDKVRRALNHGSMATTMIYVMAGELLREKRERKRKLGVDRYPVS